MPDDFRPNPDTLLAAIQKEDAKQRRGKLKVFLGMCAGVGKTYAMLEAARREFAAGGDVSSATSKPTAARKPMRSLKV